MTAVGLRQLLIDKYGPDAGVLVQRLERLSTSRNLRLALAATELLLNYHSGKPLNALSVDVSTPTAQAWPPEKVALLTTPELHMLAAMYARVYPNSGGQTPRLEAKPVTVLISPDLSEDGTR
jgi:hypothetical protein